MEQRLRGPVGSLVLHLLPLLLLINWPMSPPAETEPITGAAGHRAAAAKGDQAGAAATAAKTAPPPPRGRLASEDLGEPEAKEVDKPKGDPPASAEKPAKTETPPAETKPPEKPQQTAALAPRRCPPAKPDAPKARPRSQSRRQSRRPAAHQVPRRVEDAGESGAAAGRFPGPAATRDEYLAYMHSLIRQHYNLLPSSTLGNRRGMTVIEFVVLDDGKIALMKMRRSSGYPDIDNRVAEMVAAVGRFPPCRSGSRASPCPSSSASRSPRLCRISEAEKKFTRLAIDKYLRDHVSNRLIGSEDMSGRNVSIGGNASGNIIQTGRPQHR